MATIDDLDLGGLISKFLGSPAARARQDTQQDPIVEIQALLESVALAFLLKPALVLEFLFQARNGLIEICSAELGLLDFIKDAVQDLDNPDPDLTDVSHLIDAQTALVELDRLSRVSTDLQPYARYEASVGKFLGTLKKSVSRKGRKVAGKSVLERTGAEAKEDLLQALFYLQQSRTEMIRRLSLFRNGLTSFLATDLSRIVAQATIAKARASLQMVSSGLSAGTLSPTVAALNILTGSAALKSIVGTTKPLDPMIKTGHLPARRSIYYRATGGPASVVSSQGPWVLPGSLHDLTIEAGDDSTTIEIPYTGKSNQVWVLSDPLTAPINIPGGGVSLYVRAPGTEPDPPWSTAPIGAGSWSLSDLVAQLNAASAGLYEAYVVGPRILLVGSASRTSLSVMAYSDPTLIEYLPSAHVLLGFALSPNSESRGTISVERLLALFGTVPGVSLQPSGDGFVVTATNTSTASELAFSGHLASVFGLPALAVSEPAHAELVETGVVLDPAAEGVVVGAQVVAAEGGGGRALAEPVTQIDGTSLLFTSALPRGTLPVEVTPPLVLWWKTLSQGISGIRVESTTATVQRTFTPLLGNASRAQVADAVAALEAQRQPTQELFDALSNANLTQDQRPDRALAQNVLSSLEDHGLDRSLILLTQGDFSTFFSLSADVASRSTNLLKSIELLGQMILPQESADSQQDDGVSAVGTSPAQPPSVVRY